MRLPAFLLAILFASTATLSFEARAFTADEYRSLRFTWKLGYVAGVGHGRALYREGKVDPLETALDHCLPLMSDVQIVEIVDNYLAANPSFGTRLAVEVMIEAVAKHCLTH